MAFAAGCLPAARLAVLLAGAVEAEKLAGQNPGAASVSRILGKKAGIAVGLTDGLKGLLPVVIGRARGAGALTTEALAIAPMVAHITVVGGKGGAALGGSVLGLDPVAFAWLLPIWLGATAKKDNARGALVACLLYPPVRWVLGRSAARVWISALAPVLLIYARLRGPGWRSTPLTARLLWRRLTYDAELGPRETPVERRGR